MANIKRHLTGLLTKIEKLIADRGNNNVFDLYSALFYKVLGLHRRQAISLQEMQCEIKEFLSQNKIF